MRYHQNEIAPYAPADKHAGGWKGGGSKFHAYVRERLLGADPRFQQCPEYVFWLLETWLRRAVSNQTTIHVAPAQKPRLGRQQLQQCVYAVLRGVAGTQPYMYAKRAMALRMMAQLGPPTFFLTLTSYELQPQLLLACAFAHLRGDPATKETPLEALREIAHEAVDTLMNARGPWRGFTALELCTAYPAALAREFRRMLREFLGWLAPDANPDEDERIIAEEDKQDEVDEAETCQDGEDGSVLGGDPETPPPGESRRRTTVSRSSRPMPPHRDPSCIKGADGVQGSTKWESSQAAAAHADLSAPLEEKPPFKARDYIVRIEWQKRGMPHAHILLWVPEVNAQLMKAQEEEDKPRRPPHNYGPDDDVSDHDGAPAPTNIPEAYDYFVMTTASRRWADVYQNLVMADLASRLCHRHSAYCGYRALGACRFGFPQPAMKNARAKSSGETVASRSKNHFFARRREGASFMGLYNAVILRWWRASMDLQLVRDGYAASRYILGYVLKSEADVAAQRRFEDSISQLLDDVKVDRQEVYRASYIALQGRVTSVPEACHLVLGLPVVMFSRANRWIQVGEPETWTARIDRKDELRILGDAARDSAGITACALPAPTMPDALRRYADRPTEGKVSLPVEGTTERVEVDWEELTLFDYVAGVYKRGERSRSPPAIVGFKTSSPDQEPRAYFFAKLLLHIPWRVIGDWLQESDESDPQQAFERKITEDLSGAS